ncbi:TPM domain-containing protein [Prolixibacter denitrificans]|uniref:TLP18.3/Psb32/MOLO-1 phosphatase superfamily protein n=1 Tax=Prolixibacter denitrificans TaxID=1541063 RepID=A0A2P8C906_9BACT|nr:TPM domain-containing protein [Prolixibacter denitrificans]PSK81447.1 TLP18.3/Psb32/MOLO-1 phosphatase superfamily protein [Prolixibacter denitrificans]GET21083.1 hypothetical protein JCM18694_13290 [Prolixibacter denitrificans]
MKIEEFFSKEEQANILEAIQEAEHNTSGEIRVHIDDKCPGEVLDRGAHVFKVLDMHKTKERNGVLFYLAVGNRKFAILGDAGINKVVPENFWDEIKNKMLEYFKEGDFAIGLAEGISMAGHQLSEHFPYQEDDVNELSDEISFGK